MTRDQFIEKHKHRLAGFVVDGAVEGRRAAELALWLRKVMKEIDAAIGVMYDDLIPPKPLPAVPEGKPAQPVRK